MSREVANLIEIKNQHTPLYGVKESFYTLGWTPRSDPPSCEALWQLTINVTDFPYEKNETAMHYFASWFGGKFSVFWGWLAGWFATKFAISSEPIPSTATAVNKGTQNIQLIKHL